MTDTELMLECMKLAVPICLATADKSADAVVKLSTTFYNVAVTAGKTSSERNPSAKPKR